MSKSSRRKASRLGGFKTTGAYNRVAGIGGKAPKSERKGAAGRAGARGRSLLAARFGARKKK
jgi:hypothetical protein